MIKQTQNITILGGGSAGWLTAAYLSTNLNKDYFNISLVESPTIPSVGVGESTLTQFSSFLNNCGFSESQWFDYCESTNKAGILFKDWVKEGSKIWHPFFSQIDFNSPYSPNILDIIFSFTKSPKNISKYLEGYDSFVNHKNPNKTGGGYQINATKLANFLRNNVNISKLYLNNITKLNYQDSELLSVTLDTNETITSDIFIDCLGFNSLLKTTTSNYKFVDKSNIVPGNASLSSPIKYTDKLKQLHSYTTAQCTPYGWMWITPTQNRIGSGIVYNNKISNEEEVSKYFKEYWGEENIINPDLKSIKYTPGYFNNSWNNNVISIGLSSGFVEPLESTGLHFIQFQVINLSNFIKDGSFTPSKINAYNELVNIAYENVFDFISLHYLNTQRTEPFWKHVSNNTTISDSLKLKIDYIKNFKLNQTNEMPGEFFGYMSWLVLAKEFCNINPKTLTLDREKSKSLYEEWATHYL